MLGRPSSCVLSHYKPSRFILIVVQAQIKRNCKQLHFKANFQDWMPKVHFFLFEYSEQHPLVLFKSGFFFFYDFNFAIIIFLRSNFHFFFISFFFYLNLIYYLFLFNLFVLYFPQSHLFIFFI